MEKGEILIKLKKLLIEVAELDITIEEMDENDKNLFDNYKFDSILALEFLLRVEEQFDIEIDDEDLDSKLINDLNYLAEYVENRYEKV